MGSAMADELSSSGSIPYPDQGQRIRVLGQETVEDGQGDHAVSSPLFRDISDLKVGSFSVAARANSRLDFPFLSDSEVSLGKTENRLKINKKIKDLSILKETDWELENLKKKGYSVEDGKEILKVGRQLGFTFSSEVQALENLERLEEIDRSPSISVRSSFSRRQALSWQGYHPLFKIYCKKGLKHPSRCIRRPSVSQ